MNTVKILFFSMALLFSCSKPLPINEMEINTIKTEVNTLLDNWHRAAAEANFDQYFNAMDSLSVFIGTDAKENWTRKQFKTYCKPHFDKGKAWSFKTLERNIYVSKRGETVWFDELLNTQMGICRGSGVLEKADNQYKIKHYVLSITIPNKDVKTVVEAKRENESTVLKNYH